jgi:predicted transcriptional regulator
MKYRDRTEIITLMLRSASKENGAFKTRIMYDAFLSFSQLEMYFPYTYEITGKVACIRIM